MAHALGKARNPFIGGFYVIISSLNNVLKLRHSAQHTVGPKASPHISLRWTTCWKKEWKKEGRQDVTLIYMGFEET